MDSDVAWPVPAGTREPDGAERGFAEIEEKGMVVCPFGVNRFDFILFQRINSGGVRGRNRSRPNLLNP